MKLAVGLFGIHYIDELNHWMGWKNGVDYRRTYISQHSLIYSKFQTKFYSATYHSDIDKGILLSDYNFSTIVFTEIDNSTSNSLVKRNNIFKNTVKLILDKDEDSDLVLLTRYDLKFKGGFELFNIDYNKINFLCGNMNGNDSDLVDDNFYIIPKSLLKYFYETINEASENLSSHLYHKLFEDYNFLINGWYYSHENPFYEIRRINLKN
jgi:hypothetical protein